MQQLISITLSQQGWKNTEDNGVFQKIGGRKGGELDESGLSLVMWCQACAHHNGESTMQATANKPAYQTGRNKEENRQNKHMLTCGGEKKNPCELI